MPDMLFRKGPGNSPPVSLGLPVKAYTLHGGTNSFKATSFQPLVMVLNLFFSTVVHCRSWSANFVNGVVGCWHFRLGPRTLLSMGTWGGSTSALLP